MSGVKMRQAEYSGGSSANSLLENFGPLDAQDSRSTNGASGDELNGFPDHIDHAVLADAQNGSDTAVGESASGDALSGLGDAAPVAAVPPSDGDGLAHSVTSDGLWLNDDAGSANDLFGDGNSSAPGSGSDASGGGPAGGSELPISVADTGANANSFAVNSSSNVPDAGSAHLGLSDAADALGGTTSSNISASSIPTFTEAAASPNAEASANVAPSIDVPPASSQSDGPILAYAGDLNDGIGFGTISVTDSSSGGTGTGTGTGTSGTVVQTNGAGSGLIIDIDWDSSVANAPSGFVTAVDSVVSFYESHFSNPITITIDVGYGEIAGQALGAGDLGESETYLTSVTYTQLQTALVTNANAIGDTAAAASLPSTSPVSGAQYWIPTAEAQALGLAGASTSIDGYAGFSSTNSFAYNDANGVPAGEYDFFGTVAHEFSEIMGRQMMDGYFSSYEALDLFHYSAPGVRDFSGTTAGYFSPDGGTTNLGNFNTNANGDFGDWAGSVGANSYLAFSNSGVVNPVTANDLAVMNLLGWDPVTSASAPVVTIALAHDTGGTNNVTSNDALTGSADANAAVTLSEGSTVLGTTTANASGVWAFTPTGLAQGSQTVTASETNAAGLTGSSSLTFTYDTVAPTVTAALAHDTGGTNNITSNDALTGTADANAVVTLSEGSTVLGTTTANASGVWSFTPTGLAQGSQTVTASETNAAGLTGSSSLTFTYDTVAPTVTAALAHDTGGTNNVTSNDALTGTRRCQCHSDAERRLDRARHHHRQCLRRLVVHPDRAGARQPDRDRQRDQCRRADRQFVADLHLRHRGADRDRDAGARHRRHQQRHFQ